MGLASSCDRATANRRPTTLVSSAWPRSNASRVSSASVRSARFAPRIPQTARPASVSGQENSARQSGRSTRLRTSCVQWIGSSGCSLPYQSRVATLRSARTANASTEFGPAPSASVTWNGSRRTRSPCRAASRTPLESVADRHGRGPASGRQPLTHAHRAALDEIEGQHLCAFGQQPVRESDGPRVDAGRIRGADEGAKQLGIRARLECRALGGDLEEVPNTGAPGRQLCEVIVEPPAVALLVPHWPLMLNRRAEHRVLHDIAEVGRVLVGHGWTRAYRPDRGTRSRSTPPLRRPFQKGSPTNVQRAPAPQTAGCGTLA